jgi:hypothetical protein
MGYGSLLLQGKDGSWVKWGKTKGPPRPFQLNWQARCNDPRGLPRERQERWLGIPDLPAAGDARLISLGE